MRAVLQNMKTGKLGVEEVPAPGLQPGGVLVAVRRSLISLGTERSVIALAQKGPLGKARDRPDLARKVLNKAKQEGYWGTYKVVSNLLESPIPLGYSCAGEVLEVGSEATRYRPGDRVACAGLNFANHAEINYVPKNLVAPMPANVGFDAASFVALGAIAMQGVRLAEIELGHKVVVLGLGLVGQIATQLARCAGATVLAADIDPSKLELARDLGAHHVQLSDADLAGAVGQLTEGYGADSVLLCAASKSSALMRVAAEISRLKGKVVVVGDVGLELERRPYFEKEVSLVISRSYGPGRYDPAYETHGVDYPLPYVRWTEGRNMQSFLELLDHGQIDVSRLITHRYPIEQADTAYEIVSGKRDEPAIAIMLECSGGAGEAPRIELQGGQGKAKSEVNFGVIGAGQFAKGVLLPAFAAQSGVSFGAFCTASGLTSRNVAEKYKADYCTGDAAQILEDEKIDAVIVATRHDRHAELTSQALRRGKAVFVEKPLALTEHSLAELVATVEELESPRLMLGFNRRFSPLAIRCREFAAGRSEPLFVTYRVNAGALPPDSWVTDPVQGGGRIVGEVCHFIDTILFLADSPPLRVYAEPIGAGKERADRDPGVTVTLRMADGSVGTIHYLTNGDPSVPKETLELFAGDRVARLDNYRNLDLHRGNRRRRVRLMNQAKGHAQEVEAFVAALRSGGEMPIGLETLIAASQTPFLIQRSLESGTPVDYRPPQLSTGD